MRKEANPSHDHFNIAQTSFRLWFGLNDDNTSFSVVLRHLQIYRPHWKIDFLTDAGREKIGVGLVNRVWTYDNPPDETTYNKSVKINLFDCTANWADRPCTTCVASLHEKFGMPYDAAYGRYMVRVSDEVQRQANAWVNGKRFVGIHPEGISVPECKNLSRQALREICEFIQMMERTPLILNWQEPLAFDLQSLGAIGIADSPFKGHDAEHIAAVISACEAYIGVDSGPGKIASATDTPAAIVWTGHHPIFYQQPAPNTIHLLPQDHRRLMPNKGKSDKMLEYFERTYRHAVYQSPSQGVMEWLAQTLAFEPMGVA